MPAGIRHKPGVQPDGIVLVKLSQTRADKIKAPGRYGDGRGLYLQITQSGNRSWLLCYELCGSERFMGLGSCADFTLEEARERARLARQLLKDGIDPLAAAHEARAKAYAAAAKIITFKNAAIFRISLPQMGKQKA